MALVTMAIRPHTLNVYHHDSLDVEHHLLCLI